MSFIALSHQPKFEQMVERIRRAGRSLRVRDEQLERRRLVRMIPRKSTLENAIDEDLGYGMLPVGALDAVGAAVKFAQEIRDERKSPAKKKQDYNPTILEPKRYEDAPAFFDLVLSDNVLQIAADYLGEIPVLMGIKLWCTPASQDLEHLKGSQMFHRDGRKWLLRRAKFLVNMDNVDEDCGPFTFLPADVSKRVSESIGTMKVQSRVTDDLVYRVAKPSDNVSLIGPAGTAAAVDSSRCFHFGARVRHGERLLLQFHFLRRADAVHGGAAARSVEFDARYGGDEIRNLTIPNEKAGVSDD